MPARSTMRAPLSLSIACGHFEAGDVLLSPGLDVPQAHRSSAGGGIFGGMTCKRSVHALAGRRVSPAGGRGVSAVGPLANGAH